MATPNEKLAESLDVLKALQQGGRRVFRSDDLSRVHRERLVANGFLQEVMKGWLISSSPSARAGRQHAVVRLILGILRALLRTTVSARSGTSRRSSRFCSMARRTVIPDQVVVNSPKGTNNAIELLFGTSIYDLKVARDAGDGGSRGEGRLAAFLAGGGAGEGGGIFFRAKSGRDAGGAGEPRRRVGPAAAAAEWRPLRESGLSGGSVPADRSA